MIPCPFFAVRLSWLNLLAGRHALDLALQQRDLNPAVGCSSFLRLIVLNLLRLAKAKDEHPEQRDLVLL